MKPNTTRFSLVVALMLTIAGVIASVSANTSSQQLTISAANRVAAAPDITVGPDGSINLLWMDKGEVKPPAPPDPHAAHKGGQPGGHTHLNYSNLLFSRSTDGGRTFTAPVRVNQKEGEVWGFSTSKPTIEVSKSGIIHVFYSGNRRPAGSPRQAVDALYTRSTDGGKTFEPAHRLNTEGKGRDDGELDEAHCFGAMGVSPSGDVYAYWIDTRHMKSEEDNGAIYGAVSRNEGKTFEKEQMIFENEACPCCQVQVSFSADGKVYLTQRSVAADGSRNGTVAWSSDGKTFSARTKVSDKNWNIKACPLKPTTTAIDKSGRVYAAWFAGEMQPAGVFFSASEDRGKTFSKPIGLHPEAKVSDHAQITLGTDGNVTVAWDAKVGEVKRVYLRSSNDRGKTFGAVTELDSAAGAAEWPAIAAGKKGQVFVAWQQNGQVMFKVLPTLVAQK